MGLDGLGLLSCNLYEDPSPTLLVMRSREAEPEPQPQPRVLPTSSSTGEVASAGRINSRSTALLIRRNMIVQPRGDSESGALVNGRLASQALP